MRVVARGREGCCGGAITSTCMDTVAEYTYMSHNHLQTVGHDHESMAKHRTCHTESGRREGQVGVSPTQSVQQL